MKKFLVFFILIIVSFLSLPCFAGDLQYKWEENFYNTYTNNLKNKIISVNPDDLVTNDYKGYLNGGKSFYGMILYIQEQYQDLSDTNVNKKYSNILFDRYHLRLKAINTHTYLAGVIDIPDKEYQILDEKVKQLVASYNYTIAQDI